MNCRNGVTSFEVFIVFFYWVGVTSDGNERHEKVGGVGGDEMGESGGEHVRPVTDRAVAFVYELQLLFVCGWGTPPPTYAINNHQLYIHIYKHYMKEK
jgi:hypothetical protein